MVMPMMLMTMMTMGRTCGLETNRRETQGSRHWAWRRRHPPLSRCVGRPLLARREEPANKPDSVETHVLASRREQVETHTRKHRERVGDLERVDPVDDVDSILDDSVELAEKIEARKRKENERHAVAVLVLNPARQQRQTELEVPRVLQRLPRVRRRDR